MLDSGAEEMNEMERTIKVKGNATVTAPADITCVRTSVSGVAPSYNEAVEALTKITKKLKDAIEFAGIARNELKTSGLSVSQHYRDKKIGVDKDGHDKFKKVADGYSYYQNVYFEFPNDNDKLTVAITNIIDCKVTPDIRFFFKNSDPEKMKNDALAKAAANARSEAEIIVNAAGAKLGKLLYVDRGVGRRYDDDDYEECRFMSNSIASPDCTLDVDPEDDSCSQTVTMTWEIED